MAPTLRQRPIDVVLTKSPSSDSLSSSSSSSAGMQTFTAPTLSVKEMLAIIPAHCYERSVVHSAAYIAYDFAMIAACVYAASFIDGALGHSGSLLQGTQGEVARWAAWATYWFFVGLNMTGVWIIGHECGHQAFSTSKAINNGVGLVLHSLLLVPYHSWRISHARHHAGTGHMNRDEVFVPKTKSFMVARCGKKEGEAKKIVEKGPDGEVNEWEELLEDSPLFRLWTTVMQQLVGWPAYLFVNASGQKSYPKWTNHFDPSAIIFDARHRSQIITSDLALLIVGTGLVYLKSYLGGWGELIKWWGIPYLCVNHWLVMITYLQHTDPKLPHYRAGEWTFPRGALCTVDRNMMGWIGPYLLHGICETHIAHHISSKIPHYHAWEATAALKAKLGEHYSYSNENMFVSLWKNQKSCRYVEDEGEIVFYKDAYGRAERIPNYTSVPSDSGIDVGSTSD